MLLYLVYGTLFSIITNVIFCMESDIKHTLLADSVSTNKKEDKYNLLKTLDDQSYQKKLAIDTCTLELEKAKLDDNESSDDLGKWKTFIGKYGDEKAKIWIALKNDLLFWMDDYLKKGNENIVNDVINGIHYPLHVAIIQNAPNVLQLLLQTKPNLNLRDGNFRETPFQCALRYKQADMAKQIVTTELKQQIRNDSVNIEKFKCLIMLARESCDLELGAEVAGHIDGLINGYQIAKG